MLSWQWPLVALLLPLPILVRWLVVRWQPGRTAIAAIRVPFYQTLVSLEKPRIQGAGRPPFAAWIAMLMWALLVTAAARPVWFGDPVNIATSGRDLMIALDISDSMRIDDMQVNDFFVTRIEAIKQVASQFIAERQGDRIGLILFGQRSYLMSPLTFDRQSVVVQLQEALPGFAGSSTAIGDAIGMAIKLLRDRPAQSRVLLLMTDGSNTHGSEPAAATLIAQEADIRIHTIGVGGTHKRTVFADGRQQEIDPTRDLDEATLQAVAQKTGGQYFRARDPQEMAAIYATINELEPVPAEKTLRPQRSMFHWPLMLAMLCALILLFYRSPLDSALDLPLDNG